ncbi:hypothetical protein [Cryptosporangium minutisporangium]|uniref:C1q domain-containing protein n=1 Tax=Cryptosporangium minutisporangium TaxID=113569 RepID=A0ABP6SW83_9ACTN
MGASHRSRPVGIAFVAAALACGLAACSGGDPAARPSDRPTSDATANLPSPDRTVDRSVPADDAPTEQAPTEEAPAEGAPADSPRPTRSFDVDRSATPDEPQEPAESARPPLAASPGETPAAEPTRSQPADVRPAESQPAATPSVAAAEENNTMGPLICVLVVIVAALAGGALLISRSQRRSAWDREAQELRAETQAATDSRLPPVLNTTAVTDRTVVWPPIRTGLVGLVGRWEALVQNAPNDARRDWAVRIGGYLQALIAAVDAESEGIAVGRSWQDLRPGVLDAHRVLTAVLQTDPDSPPVAFSAAPGQPPPPPPPAY